MFLLCIRRVQFKLQEVTRIGIVGHLPAGWRDVNNYETRMKNAWGDHFVSLNEIEGDVVSREYREAVADTIYNKLVEMGYCEVQEQTQE